MGRLILASCLWIACASVAIAQQGPQTSQNQAILTALNQSVTLNPAFPAQTCTLTVTQVSNAQYTSPFVGSVTFAESGDGSTFTTLGTVTTPGNYVYACGGYYTFRATMSAYTSGAATVLIVANPNASPGTVPVSGPSIQVPYTAANCSGQFIVANCPPYNATGNGTTDDTAAVQAALTAASAISGTVYFKPTQNGYSVSSTIIDTNANMECIGGGANGSGNAKNSCYFRWVGSTGGTVISVQPPVGQVTTRNLTISQIGVDGNSESAATCWQIGSSYSQYENLAASNCSKYELLLAGQSASVGVAHNHIDTFTCQNYTTSDCIHLGLFANSEGATQNSIDNVGLQYGLAGRGIVFDFADENTITNAATYTAATSPTTTTAVYTVPANSVVGAAYTPTTAQTTIAVANTAQFVVNTGALLAGYGYVYINTIVDSTHLAVTNSTIGAASVPSGTSISEENDSIAFLNAGSYNFVYDCIGCFVHSYNQSAFQAYPVANTVSYVDHGDNGVLFPLIESFSLLNYTADSGIQMYKNDVQHVSCAAYNDCLYLADGLKTTTRPKTTSEYNINSSADNLELDDANGHVGGVTMSGSAQPGHLTLNCIVSCIDVAVTSVFRMSDSLAHFNSGISAPFDFNGTNANVFTLGGNADVNGVLGLGSYPTATYFNPNTTSTITNGINGGAMALGKFGIGTLATFDTSGNMALFGQLSETPATPADNATCTAGKIWVDANYIYVCTATNTVKRAALSTF